MGDRFMTATLTGLDSRSAGERTARIALRCEVTARGDAAGKDYGTKRLPPAG